LAVHPDLSLTLSNYIHPFSHSGASVLDSLELEEKEHLRKKLNLTVCKLLLKLMKLKPNFEAERARLLELAASGDEIEDVRSITHKMLTFHNTKD
jgi:hypothetical protein